MPELPPIIGRYDRTRVVILVTGRTAVARVGGVPAVVRHVAAARRLGLEPIVLFPPRMRALGAEIAGEVGEDVPCIPASEYTAEDERGSDLELVIAGDWYIAPGAIVGFNERTHGPAVARFEDRGRVVAPIARIERGALQRLIPKLGSSPAAELIHAAADPQAQVFPLAVAERHRLSDNVAVARCEQKLFASSDDLADPWHYRLLQRWVAVPLTRFLARTVATPAQVAALKIATGLVAAWVISRASYGAAVAGALLFFASRILDMLAGDLARSSLREGARGERFDVTGEIAVQIAMVWGIAQHVGGRPAAIAAAIATAGILISVWVAYLRVFRELWAAEARGERPAVNPSNFGNRFWKRNGPTYGLLLTALIDQLRAFLWAVAVGSHLFWLLWLTTEGKEERQQ
ncbi:MAG: hypothetical protein D6815_05355 [Candidatus Dadabacteria bacterium]|nr:MAG: hypothetical protein D6815_05355 [Candidatus Dadabacteria bacterium]